MVNEYMVLRAKKIFIDVSFPLHHYYLFPMFPFFSALSHPPLLVTHPINFFFALPALLLHMCVFLGFLLSYMDGSTH